MVLPRWLRAPSHGQGETQWPWLGAHGRYLPHAVTILWFLHIQLLLLLDSLVAAVHPAVQRLPTAYYLAQSLPPLIILGMALIRPLARWLDRRLLMIAVVAMTILPLVLTPLTLATPQPGPLMDLPNAMALRMLPLHLLALIIMAWQYRWPHIVGLFLGSGAVLLILNRLTWTQLPTGGVSLVVIAYLINGRCFTLLIDRLRDKSQALAQANQQLRHYASALEQLTVSRERNRMARELHDTLAHTLADLIVQMETAKAYLRVNPATTATILDTALVSARSGLHDTRRSLKSLRASPLVELGLAAALGELAQATAEVAALRLDLTIDVVLPTLPPDSEQAIYRIAQEALANVNYHAGASHLTVALTAAPGMIHLLVQDDGRGFQPDMPVTEGHYGLAGMAEWAQITGGRLTVTSAPNHGTTVRADIGA
jgi:signal transduction histidine kinase